MLAKPLAGAIFCSRTAWFVSDLVENLGLNNIYYLEVCNITFHITWQIKCQDWKTSHMAYRHPLQKVENLEDRVSSLTATS